ncbi:MAG: lamin tail domain-containing protein [Candidatus Altiarchaeota archaeon]
MKEQKGSGHIVSIGFALLVFLLVLFLYLAYATVAENVTIDSDRSLYTPGDTAVFSSELNFSGRALNITLSINGSDLDINCSLPLLSEGDYFTYGECGLDVILRVPPGHGGGLGYSSGLTELNYSINWTIPIPRVGGIYCASISVWDFPGGELLLINSTCFNITGTDLTPPVISNEHPSNNSFTTDRRAPITASMYDDESGVDINTLSILLDGTNITSQTIKTTSFFIYNPTTDYGEGRHTINVSVADQIGNMMTEPYVWSFVVDTVSPILIEQTPDEGDLIPNAVGQRFTLRYTEANPKTVRLYYKGPNQQFYNYEDLSWCDGGTNETCTINLDLRGYDPGDELLYYFLMIDEVSHIASFIPYNVTIMYSAPPDVVINEFLAVPRPGEQEFIELYAYNNVDLSGWELDDEQMAGSTPYTIPNGTSISAGEFKVFYGNITGVVLDDDEDDVRLLNASGSLIDIISYSITQTENISTCLYPDGNGDVNNCTPTPGSSNIPLTGIFCTQNITVYAGWNLFSFSCNNTVGVSSSFEAPTEIPSSEVVPASRRRSARRDYTKDSEKTSCNDGLLNHGETGLDCGGPCPLCPGQTTSTTVTSTSSSTTINPTTTVAAMTTSAITSTTTEVLSVEGELKKNEPSCEDGIKNQGEIGLDCGGPCLTCLPEEVIPTGLAVSSKAKKEDGSQITIPRQSILSSLVILVLAISSLIWFFLAAKRSRSPIHVSKTNYGGVVRVTVKNRTRRDIKNFILDDLIHGLEVSAESILVDGKTLDEIKHRIQLLEDKIIWEADRIKSGAQHVLEYKVSGNDLLPIGKISWGGWC